MSRVLTPNFAKPSAKTKSLIQRMARFDLHDRLELIGNAFETFGLRTSFTLADQVLTHALVSSGAKVEFVVDLDATKEAHIVKSLQTLTRETYALTFNKRLSEKVETVLVSDNVDKYIAKDKVKNLITINPLADWTSRELIDYVLAHEVPVDPAEILALQPESKIQAA